MQKAQGNIELSILQKKKIPTSPHMMSQFEKLNDAEGASIRLKKESEDHDQPAQAQRQVEQF